MKKIIIITLILCLLLAACAPAREAAPAAYEEPYCEEIPLEICLKEYVSEPPMDMPVEIPIEIPDLFGVEEALTKPTLPSDESPPAMPGVESPPIDIPDLFGNYAVQPSPLIPTAQSILEDFRHSVMQVPAGLAAMDIAIFDVIARFSLFAEPAGDFLAGIDLSGFTPAQGDFSGMGFASSHIPSGSIRLNSSGFGHQMLQMLFEKDSNTAHFMGGILEDGLWQFTFDYFYYVPAGFYDALYALVREFYQYRVR